MNPLHTITLCAEPPLNDHNNTSDINVETSEVGNGGESEKKKLFTFSAPFYLPSNLFKHFTKMSETLCSLYVAPALTISKTSILTKCKSKVKQFHNTPCRRRGEE
jgi:hypothetical protein